MDQLSFEELSNPPTPSQGPQSIASKIILEPKHEKRDSGISGIEDPVKILDGGEDKEVLRQGSVESVCTVEDNEEEATDDEEGVITHIDEVRCLYKVCLLSLTHTWSDYSIVSVDGRSMLCP